MNYFSDIKLLHIFTTVFKQRSISGASRILNITQPSVTRSIHSLELELGLELFIRSSEGLMPTDFAFRLYRRALTIIDEVDSIFTDAEHLSSNNRILLNIGVGHGYCSTVEHRLLEYRKGHEEVVFNMKIASARHLLSNIETGVLECIIGNIDTLNTASWLMVEKLAKTNRYIVARKEHPVFREPVEKQMDLIRLYPYVTYHLLEDSHGTKIPKAPLFRINDHLILFDNLKHSDAYSMIDEELMQYLDLFDLAVAGGSSCDTQIFAIAYNKQQISKEGKALVGFLLESENS